MEAEGNGRGAGVDSCVPLGRWIPPSGALLLASVLPSAPLVTHLQGYELTREEMAHAVAKGENLAMQPSYAQFIASNSSTKIPRRRFPMLYALSLSSMHSPRAKEYLQSMDANLYTQAACIAATD